MIGLSALLVYVAYMAVAGHEIIPTIIFSAGYLFYWYLALGCWKLCFPVINMVISTILLVKYSDNQKIANLTVGVSFYSIMLTLTMVFEWLLRVYGSYLISKSNSDMTQFLYGSFMVLFSFFLINGMNFKGLNERLLKSQE
jgi:hypothetical protein